MTRADLTAAALGAATVAAGITWAVRPWLRALTWPAEADTGHAQEATDVQRRLREGRG